MISRLIQHFIHEELIWENYVEILATLSENYWTLLQSPAIQESTSMGKQTCRCCRVSGRSKRSSI